MTRMTQLSILDENALIDEIDEIDEDEEDEELVSALSRTANRTRRYFFT
jgi:hypothetical protein